jgi:hypothetical protein
MKIFKDLYSRTALFLEGLGIFDHETQETKLVF